MSGFGLVLFSQISQSTAGNIGKEMSVCVSVPYQPMRAVLVTTWNPLAQNRTGHTVDSRMRLLNETNKGHFPKINRGFSNAEKMHQLEDNQLELQIYSNPVPKSQMYRELLPVGGRSGEP